MGVPDRPTAARPELTDAVALGRVVPDDEIDIGPLGFADYRQRAQDIDTLLASRP